jgi:class 3 adenylate cyclase
MLPKTRYVKGPEGHIAYQVFGEGPRDIILLPDHPTNVEIMWEEPSLSRFLTRLSAMGRVVCFDMRGTGLSDPVPLGALPTLEKWMDDVRTVADAAGCGRVTLLGHGSGGRIAILFAAMHPDRTESLALLDTYARFVRARDYACGMPPDVVPRHLKWMIDRWGSGDMSERAAPSLAGTSAFREWRGRYERHAMSPGQILAAYPAMVLDPDVRQVLGTVRVPTLVIQRNSDYVRPGHGRYLAAHIPQAKYLELPDRDYVFHTGDTEAILSTLQEFLTGERELHDDERVLATILFVDIVGSTELASELGDRAWRDLLERHQAVVARELSRFRGVHVDSAGDGMLATFDGPARGVRCALAIRDAARQIGVEVRAGLHSGECERIGDKVAGIAVHIGARVSALAAPAEVLVSSTVKDLVAGSGLRFAERGSHVLKGVTGEWQLFAAE